jgi:hypothetical protein
MFAKIIANLIGVLVFLFIFWKKLKEDYSSREIFTTGFYILIGGFVGSFLSWKFFPNLWFWLVFIGLLAGFILGVLRFRLRTFETLEAVIIATLPWLSFVFIEDAMAKNRASSFFAFLVVVLLIALYFLLDAHYKRFAWYKSGRVGFSGLTTLGLFFLIRAVVALIFSDVISFVGKIEATISGIVAFIFFFLVFNLSRAKT